MDGSGHDVFRKFFWRHSICMDICCDDARRSTRRRARGAGVTDGPYRPMQKEVQTMQQIKFRAWDIIRKKMMEVHRLDWIHNKAYISAFRGRPYAHWYPLADLILLQYADLKDDSGTDLDWWEGDVIEWFWNGLSYRRVISIPEIYREHINWQNVRKLGNIHEEPELLPKAE